MERIFRDQERMRPLRLDLVLMIAVGLLLGGTVVLTLDPKLDFVIIDRSLDVAVNSLTTLASAGLAVLAMSRHRESRLLSTLFQASALFLLAVTGAVNVLFVLLKLDGRIGLTLGLPGQFPVYLVSIAGLMSAVLFFLGAIATVRNVKASHAAARRLIVGPPLALGGLALILYALRDVLPPLIGPSGIDALIRDPQTASPLPGLEPLLLVIIAATAMLLFVAAMLFRSTYIRGGPVTDSFLAIGLVIASFAAIHFALFPGVYTGFVSTGDTLRLAFYAVLLLGIDAEARSDLRALRAAYAALDHLRITEAERAALEERSRLAREIHDGLAQHLWFAKLKHERLAPLVPDSARGLSAEVGEALDAAIVESRQALVTMRSGTDPQQPLTELLMRTMDEFGNRTGLRAEFTAEELPASIPARPQAELLRVVQEALSNVGKHADATMVRVRAFVEGDDLVVTVTDNGRGFDPTEERMAGMGLRGMAERARLIGGQLEIRSEPSDGTRVSVRVPVSVATSITTAVSIVRPVQAEATSQPPATPAPQAPGP